MDFSHIIQGTRQYFQGHPGLDETAKNPTRPAPFPPPHHTPENWPQKSGRTVDIPPEIEARYARHALRLPISNGHPSTSQSHYLGNQQQEPGNSEIQSVNGNNFIPSKEHHERPKTSEGPPVVQASKTQKHRAETPLDLSVKPEESMVLQGPPNFPSSQDPSLIHQQRTKTVQQLPVETSSFKVDSYSSHSLLRPQHHEVHHEQYSVPENPYLGHHQSGSTVICRPVNPGNYRQELQQQNSLSIHPHHSPQMPLLARLPSEPQRSSDGQKPENGSYTSGLKLPNKNMIPSNEARIQRPQADPHPPTKYNLFQPYQKSAEPSPAVHPHPPQSYSGTYAQPPHSPAGPAQTQHTVHQFHPPQDRSSVHHLSPYVQPSYLQSYPPQPTLLTHRPSHPQLHQVEIGQRPLSQPLHGSRQPPPLLPPTHSQASEPIRWSLPQHHFESRLPSILQAQLQPSEPVQRPLSQQHHDTRPASAQQLRTVANETVHRPPSVEQLNDSRLPSSPVPVHSHPQFRSSHLTPHQVQPFPQSHTRPHPSEVVSRPQYDGRSSVAYLTGSNPVHRPQHQSVPFQHTSPGQLQTTSRPQSIPLSHPFPSASSFTAPQHQQRVPPVATVSATVRNSVAGSPAIPPAKIITPVVGSKREAFPLPSRPTFPWLQRNTSRPDGKILLGINPPVAGSGALSSTQSGKPVGVAMVSFKAAPSASETSAGPSPSRSSVTSPAPYAKEMSKPRELNLATHPFPHLAAAAAAANARTSSAVSMPLKFRTKAELKQMSNLTPPPTIPSPFPGTQLVPLAIPVPVVVPTPVLPPPAPVHPPDPIIEDEKWPEFSKPLANEWESFMKDLKESTNIKRICRVTKPPPKPAGRRARQEPKPPAPAPIKKNIQDYSSDEDIPLSLRQKVVQDRQRAERLERRKRRCAPTRIRVCKRRIMSDSESESQSDNNNDSSASVSLDENESDSEESSDSDEEATIVDRIRLRRSTLIQRRHSPNSAASSTSLSGNSRQSSSSSSYPSGWEGDALNFKQQLRMPPQLINVCKPRNGREAPDLPAKKAAHHIRCVNMGAKRKNPLRIQLKNGKKKKSIELKRTMRLTVHSQFAWDKRWNYHMFRSSLFYCVSSRRRKRRQTGQSNVMTMKCSTRPLIKCVGRGSKTKQNKKVAQVATPAKKRLRINRRRFRSGFDYIRKKKKKLPTPNCTDQRPKAPTKDYHLLGASLDPATEFRSWSLNKSVGETLLHRAARLGYLDGVLHLVERPETIVSAKDNAGYTPLHEACTRGHLEVARVLLQYGADESSSAQGGIRPLHQAVENDHIEVVRLLLSFGADPTLATYGGQTPLMSCESDAMRLFLTAHLEDMNGNSVRPWVFEGSVSFMDECESGVLEHPLNSSLYVDALHSKAIALDSSRSFDAVDIQLYELVDRRLNPWLQLDSLVDYLIKGPPHLCDALSPSSDQQEAVSRQLALQLIVDTSASRVTLSSQSFASLAVPVLYRGLLYRPRLQSTQPLTLLHYNDRVQKLLDVESVTFLS